MDKMQRYLLGLLVMGFALLVGACEKNDGFRTRPEISLIDFGPAVVKEFQDSIYFRLQYTDGDGDLGENNTDTKNLYVEDSRVDVTYSWRIRQLVADSSNVPISGILSFYIPNTLITNGEDEEEVFFKIYVVDRAGNQSKKIKTETIRVQN